MDVNLEGLEENHETPHILRLRFKPIVYKVQIQRVVAAPASLCFNCCRVVTDQVGSGNDISN